MPSAAYRRGRANACATTGCERWNAVSKHATWGSPGALSETARMAARLWGWCRGASGTSSSSRRRVSVSTTWGPAKSAPPWTTRWPAAATRCPERTPPAASERRKPIAPSCPRRGPSAHFLPATTPDASRAVNRGRVATSSMAPWRRSRGGPSSRKTENFRLEEPALTTRRASGMRPGSVRPDPVGELRPVGAVLVRVVEVVEDRVLHLFFQMRRPHGECRHPVDDVDDEVKARGLVQHRQLQRRVDVPLLLVAPHVQVRVPPEPVSELVD